MEVRVLGDIAVVDDRGERHPVPGEVQRRLLALLSVEQGRVVSTDRLVEELWGADGPSNPANALQSRISRLRRLFVEAGGPGAIEHRDGGYLLSSDVDLDAERFEAAVRAGDHAAAVELWDGEPFADADGGSVLQVERRRLGELRAAAIESVLGDRLRDGEPSAVIGELEALVAADPLRERPWALLMTAYSRSGRRADALDAYQRARRTLAAELGIDPGAELQELERQVLDGTVDEPASTTPPRPRPRVRRMSSTLLGRERELHDLTAAIRAHRLVTITGPGGVGKTRLLTELAATAEQECVLVELVALGAGDIASQIAVDLGVRQGDLRDDPLLDRIVFAIDGRGLLLALDNAEHLLDEAAEVIDVLLRRSDVRVVVTSREPLGVQDEQHLPLAPFPLPLVPDPSHPAIELFVRRASQRRPGWSPSPDELATIAELCRRLDGVPLALELAAARTAALSPSELLERLDPARLSGRTGGPEHHRSVSTMLDWSYDRLGDDERLVLQRLSAFSGPASLAAVEAVAADGVIEHDRVAELLVGLVDRSLVVAVDHEGRRRFDLLSLVRAHARHRADAGELDRAARRLVAWALALVGDADVDLRSPNARRAWATLRAEHEQLLHALDEARRLDLPQQVGRLVRSLSWWWFISGRHEVALRWVRVVTDLDDVAPLDRGIAQGIGALMGLQPIEAAGVPLADDRRDLARMGREAAEGVDRTWEMLLRLTEAFSEVTAGQQDQAAEAAERVRAQAADLGDVWAEAVAGLVLGTAHFWVGRLNDAVVVVEEALATAERAGDPWVVGLLLGNRSALREAFGDLAGARADVEAGLALLGDEPDVLSPEAPTRLADLATLEGDPESGYALATEAIERVRRLGAVGWHGGSYCSRGMAARRLGRIADAAADFALADELYEQQGFHLGRILAKSGLGFCAEEAGDLVAAREHHTDELQLARAFGDPRAVALALEGLAAVEVGEGDPLAALRLLGEADALRRSTGGPLPEAERIDVDRVERACRAALGDEVVDLTLGSQG
ncbi:MAG: BTAD domain-containing putative transcriptional regulator [Actinomycetota bacterium]